MHTKMKLAPTTTTPNAKTIEVPDGWTSRSVGEIGQIVTGATPRTTNQAFWNGTIPFVTPTDLGRTKKVSSTGRHVSDEGLMQVREIPAGAVMVTCIASIGKLGIAAEKCCTNQQINAVITGDSVLSEYFYYAMAFGSRSLAELAGTTAVPIISKSSFSAYRVMVPPLSEQRRIAAILSSVDDVIEKTQATVDQAQVVKRGVMQELFTHGLPGRHARFRRTESVGEIPSGWTIFPLVDACVARGQYGANVAKRDFAPGGIRYIRITDIDEHGSLKDASVGINAPDAGGYLLAAGDILLARSGTVGKSYLHEDIRVRCAFAGYLVRFRTRDEVLLPAFLKEYLNTAAFWRWVADRQHAQAQPNINAREYGQLPVPCPPLDEQRRIVDIAASFTGAIQSGRVKVRCLHRLKQSLLSVLLTGELRVTTDTEAA